MVQGLGCFYGVGLGLAVEEVALPSKEDSNSGGGKTGDKDKDVPVTCLRGVAVSAWNPPPPQRRMVGDLMYLEACLCLAFHGPCPPLNTVL